MITDGPREIEMCLNCTRPDCNDCLRDGLRINRKKKPWKMKVCQKDDKGNVIAVFDTQAEAAQAVGALPSGISTAITKKRRCMGWYWEPWEQSLQESSERKCVGTMGQNMRRARERAKVSREELSRNVGISAQTLAKWERDASNPTLHLIVAICTYLNISLDEYVRGVRDDRVC